MNYEQKYKEALGWMRELYTSFEGCMKEDAEHYFPELAESEDEIIKREILELVSIAGNGNQFEEIKDWLEKQGESNPAEKVGAKFKVKYSGSEYNVLEIKESAGVTYYGVEDEPNHIDYIKADNCEIINGGYGVKEDGFSIPTKPAMFSDNKESKKLDPERVIEWLKTKVYDDSTYGMAMIDQFKKDFGL